MEVLGQILGLVSWCPQSFAKNAGLCQTLDFTDVRGLGWDGEFTGALGSFSSTACPWSLSSSTLVTYVGAGTQHFPIFPEALWVFQRKGWVPSGKEGKEGCDGEQLGLEQGGQVREQTVPGRAP